MTRYWVLVLIVAVVGLLLIARHLARRHEADDTRDTLLPRRDDDPAQRADLDDTAPSVLSPPEWSQPPSPATGPRR